MLVYAFLCFCLWLLGDVVLTESNAPFLNPFFLKQISSPPTVNSVSDTDKTEMISVMEGGSVTLNTAVTEIQTNHLILWTFRLQNSETSIAEIYKHIISVYDIGENERFRDRLQIDNQTGSLTITNINNVHSGLYKLLIKNERVKYKTFNIAVHGILPVPVIIRDSSQNSSSSSGSSVSRCVLLCSVVNVEYQEKNTYSCVINNPIRNQTKHLDNSELCQPSSESNQTSLLLVVLLLVLLLLVVPAVAVLICRRRNYTQAKQEAQSNEEEEVYYTDATFIKQRDQDTETNAHDRTVYSEVVLRR
ncbi:SLAM family member 5-like isoform X2 [Onychostoma macrolepis]|uniref:SLAM family member 5-like isoform X2 n=1 Tax=Onychostoma macrolepis TaxID=369639 RepID=UPI00272C216F|nr:SLAM family member 5-like isoform X2 [Onychostoma macrolepis]